jgi:branched-chain amino acid transport system permease protein
MRPSYLPSWARLPAQPLVRHLSLAVLAGVGFYVITLLLGEYDNLQLAEIAAYVMAIAGLSVLTGTNGQISLGHGAFMLVGGYTTALLMEHFDLPLVLPIAAAAVSSAAIGALVGLPATRLRGPYLAGVTLALALALPDLTFKYSSVFGGDQGLTVNPPTPPAGVDPERWLAWISLLGALVVLVVLANLLSSRVGRSMRAVRDDEIAAALCGISPARTRVLAFTVSAACAGLAGSFLALSLGVVNPSAYPLFLSISLLAGMVLGGTGTLAGAWWGGILLVYLPQWSTSLSGHLGLSAAVAANVANGLFGVVLITVTLLAPAGLQGWLRALYHLTARAITRRPEIAVSIETERSTT